MRVILHRVGRDVQGPIDSIMAGSRGEFRFRFVPDTAAIYLLSAGWQGIQYFSSPVHTDPSAPDTGLAVVVSDTSSTAPIDVLSRHLVISKPGQTGTRSALEIIVLANGGQATRVVRDSAHPTWVGGLPHGALGFESGSGDFSGDAVQFRNDSILLFAPIAPGEKQLIFTYSIPAASGPVKIAVPDTIGMFNILLEEFDLAVKGGGIEKSDSQTIENRKFQQWAGPAVAGSVITINLPGKGLDAWILPLLVGAVAVALVLIAVKVMRNKPLPVTARSSALDQLAQLDARYAGKEASVPAEEWQQYQAERARLKQEVSAQLARTRPRS
ncbi:MAG: hypothetical protein U0133_19285 [Gemmatimonadales bacterium]